MTRAMKQRFTTLFGLAATLSMLAVSAEAQTITQVMSGLDSPRGLAFGPEGGLYVTEAGVPVNSGNCVVVALGMNCYSETGSVTRLYEACRSAWRQACRPFSTPSAATSSGQRHLVSGTRRRLHHARLGRRSCSA